MSSFDSGINQAARASWSGDRATPPAGSPLPGFYTGIVMDDADDQRMGQVWVYVPGISQRRLRKEQASQHTEVLRQIVTMMVVI